MSQHLLTEDVREVDEPPNRMVFLTHTIDQASDTTTREAFREKYFPGTSLEDWNDWRWQLRHRIRTARQLSAILDLSEDERIAITAGRSQLAFAITPYYASLLDPENPMQPLRRTVVPVTAEFSVSPGESIDPLNEEGQSPVPGLVHRYPDRVLFLVTNFCSTYCRYCTRSRIVGNALETIDPQQWEAGLSYIASHPEVRDVLVSGGDPLTLGDEKLEWLLSRLRAIPHVEIIRIGTKVPVVLPQRITRDLVSMLKRYHPLYINIHFTHPDELSEECGIACTMLADGGIPLGSQTVLLAGINDDPATMKRLVTGLLKIRVRPYYLYQCDPILGSAHFRTPVSRGMAIIEALRGYTTGLAIPTFVIDAPGGGGKIEIAPQNVVSRAPGDLRLRNYRGLVYSYPDHSDIQG